MRLKSKLLGVLLAALGLAGCASEMGGRTSDASYAASEPAGPQSKSAAMGHSGMPAGADGAPSMTGEMGMSPPSPEPGRPGLGTEWGESRKSTVSAAPFVRADARSPFSTASMFYNDDAGAKQMASVSGFKRSAEGAIDIGGGIATARLKDGTGKFLSGFEAGGRKFMVGAAGDRYSIVVQSNVPARIEVVISVDGLDVIDGQEAGFAKRGYIMGPHATIEVDGFRQSSDTVAAFRFGAVSQSYAEKKHGESRNVGVIGVALFNEQGSNPSSWPIGDASQRLNADPFPGKFATPP